MERLPRGLEAWSARSRFRPVQGLFFSRAEISPEAPAVICGDHFRSYAEIACRACALSERLTAAGAGRDEAVAVMMESGWERIVAMLGILATGAGYVPIDPAWPEAVRHEMLREEHSKLIVTQPCLQPRLAAHESRPIVTVEGTSPAADEPWTPRSRQNPGDLACTCHGVRRDGHSTRLRFDHGAAATQVTDVNERHGVDSTDSLFELGALDSTVAPYDPFGPLAVGGAVVIPTRDEAARPAQWLDLIQDYAPTIWSSTPALLQTLVDAASPQRASALVSLRLILVATEAIPVELARATKKLVTHARVVAVPAFVGERANKPGRAPS
jgi:non-ribosomal peptide synthetase component F